MLGPTTQDVYAERFKSTFDSATSATDGEYSTATATLDLTDQKLFDTRRKSANDYRAWKAGEVGTCAAHTPISHRTALA